MKIGIFLTGHIRRAHRCVSYLQEQFFNKHDCDLYVATWDVKSHWNIGADHPDHHIKVDEQYLRNIYGDRLTNFSIHNAESYERERVGLVKNNRENDSMTVGPHAFLWPTQPNRFLDQHFMVKNAYNLCTDEKFMSYDLIFKNRADVLMQSPLNLEAGVTELGYHTGHQFLQMHGNDIFSMEDKFFWGRPGVVRKGFFLYDHLQNMYDVANINIGCSEEVMAYYLTKWQVPVPICVHGDIQYTTPTED